MYLYNRLIKYKNNNIGVEKQNAHVTVLLHFMSVKYVSQTRIIINQTQITGL